MHQQPVPVTGSQGSVLEVKHLVCFGAVVLSTEAFSDPGQAFTHSQSLCLSLV